MRSQTGLELFASW